MLDTRQLYKQNSCSCHCLYYQIEADHQNFEGSQVNESISFFFLSFLAVVYFSLDIFFYGTFFFLLFFLIVQLTCLFVSLLSSISTCFFFFSCCFCSTSSSTLSFSITQHLSQPEQMCLFFQHFCRYVPLRL